METNIPSLPLRIFKKLGRTVLCLDRQALTERGIPTDTASSIYDFSFKGVSPNDFSYINTQIVDSKAHPDSFEAQIAYRFPQLNGYVLVENGGKYLSYARRVSNESRLLNSRSIGFGGHSEPEDIVYDIDTMIPTYFRTLLLTAQRELQEELQISVDILDIENENKLIVDNRHNTGEEVGKETLAVGRAHVGVLLILHLTNEQASSVLETSEAQELRWLTPDELLEDWDLYESWSQILINDYLVTEQSREALSVNLQETKVALSK